MDLQIFYIGPWLVFCVMDFNEVDVLYSWNVYVTCILFCTFICVIYRGCGLTIVVCVGRVCMIMAMGCSNVVKICLVQFVFFIGASLVVLLSLAVLGCFMSPYLLRHIAFDFWSCLAFWIVLFQFLCLELICLEYVSCVLGPCVCDFAAFFWGGSM